jgi:hypothetical protein
MKYCSPTRKHRARPPRTRVRVPCHLPTTNPSSAKQRTPHLIDPRSTPHPYFDVPRKSLHLLTKLAQGPLNPIQNP